MPKSSPRLFLLLRRGAPGSRKPQAVHLHGLFHRTNYEATFQIKPQGCPSALLFQRKHMEEGLPSHPRDAPTLYDGGICHKDVLRGPAGLAVTPCGRKDPVHLLPGPGSRRHSGRCSCMQSQRGGPPSRRPGTDPDGRWEVHSAPSQPLALRPVPWSRESHE